MMPILGSTPLICWNSSLLASEHTSFPDLPPPAGAACAVSAVEHTALAIIAEPTVQLHHARILTSRAGDFADWSTLSLINSILLSLTTLILLSRHANGELWHSWLLPSHGDVAADLEAHLAPGAERLGAADERLRRGSSRILREVQIEDRRVPLGLGAGVRKEPAIRPCAGEENVKGSPDPYPAEGTSVTSSLPTRCIPSDHCIRFS